MIKLIDYSPRWVSLNTKNWPELKQGEVKIGFTFICPHCKTKRLAILFSPVIDTNDVMHLIPVWDIPEGLRWDRVEGELFDNITITPSINVIGHYHCIIVKGELKVQTN